jgi:nucleotide-binding universal stress UspA family protein
LIGSTARDIIHHAREPVVVAGPRVGHAAFGDDAGGAVVGPLGVDHLVACVDGTPASELGIPVAIAWAGALGMQLTLLTVAEPSPPPLRIGAPWRRDHGPNEDADEYMVRLAERWAPAVPGLDTDVVYDPISAGSGMRDYLRDHPTGLVAVTSHVRGALPHLVLGSGAAQIVHASTAPVVVIPLATVGG